MGIDRTDAITGLNYRGDVDVAICTDELLRADIKESIENLARFIPFDTFGKIDAARLSLWFIERNADELDRRQPPDDFTKEHWHTIDPRGLMKLDQFTSEQLELHCHRLVKYLDPYITCRAALAELEAHINEIERRIGRWAVYKMGWYITPERKDEFTALEKKEAEWAADAEARFEEQSKELSPDQMESLRKTHKAFRVMDVLTHHGITVDQVREAAEVMAPHQRAEEELQRKTDAVAKDDPERDERRQFAAELETPLS